MATVTIHRSLGELASSVGDAMARAAQPGLHDRLDWLRFLLRYTPPAGEPALVHAQAGDGGLVLPLSAKRARGAALTNWYTLRWAPIRWGRSKDLFSHAAAALAGLGTIRLGLLEPADARELGKAFRALGWRAEELPDKAHWVARTDGLSFGDFWAARPSRLRNTVARKRKKAGLDIEIAREFDADVWGTYEDVYAHSWKPEEGSPAFLRALAQAEGAAGTLRFGIARLEGRAIAGQLWLVENSIATIHKLAYREDQRALSPGSILSAAMFEHVLTQDRPRLVSYGLGDEGYKADWMDERLELRALHLRNPRHPVGLASIAKAAARRLVKRGWAG